MLRYFLVFVFFAQWDSAHAEKLTLEQVKKVQAELSGFDHLTVEMEQTRYVAMRDRKSKSFGRSHFSRPARFRWIISRPIATQWIYDGSSIYNFDPETNSAKRYNAKGGRGQDIRQIVDAVMNSEVLFKKYDLVDAKREQGVIHVRLKPKHAKSQPLSAIELKIDEGKKYVSTVKLVNRNQNYMSVSFTAPKKTVIKKETYRLGPTVKISDGL